MKLFHDPATSTPSPDPALQMAARSLATLQHSFAATLPSFTHPEQTQDQALESVLAQVATRLEDNYPYHHPLYAGQMLKPPHPAARAAYAMAMWLNPNNHALDGGRASSAMEMEAVAQLASMFGWTTFLGHLTSGGTFANLEALWVAGRLAPGKRVLASSQAHYTHSRISSVLQLPFTSIPVDAHGLISLADLEAELQAGNVGTVVATLGTTGVGAVDPLPGILALRERYGFRLHVDAAYGGYYRLLSEPDNPALDPATANAYRLISQADSIVIDPHKHGLQPYGCGCVLFREPAVGTLYKHDSPYTYFTSSELHLGEISLECSRAGASAVALWATQQLLPLTPNGEFAQGLGQCRAAALALTQHLKSDTRFLVPFAPQLDIVVAALAAPTAQLASQRAQQVFDGCAVRNLHLALISLPTSWFHGHPAAAGWGSQDTVLCMRSVQIKPEHLAWGAQIWDLLSQTTDEVLSSLCSST